MKKFKVLVMAFVALAFVSGFSGCEKKDMTSPEKMHWDRDMCERCKMAVSDRSYAVQVVEPKTHKHYKFDDIGCAVLWFKEENIDWGDKAVIWVKDGKTGKWIDARRAWYSTGDITPMGFGFTAFANKEDAGKKEVIDFKEVERRILSRGR